MGSAGCGPWAGRPPGRVRVAKKHTVWPLPCCPWAADRQCLAHELLIGSRSCPALACPAPRCPQPHPLTHPTCSAPPCPAPHPRLPCGSTLCVCGARAGGPTSGGPAPGAARGRRRPLLPVPVLPRPCPAPRALCVSVGVGPASAAAGGAAGARGGHCPRHEEPAQRGARAKPERAAGAVRGVPHHAAVASVQYGMHRTALHWVSIARHTARAMCVPLDWRGYAAAHTGATAA